MSKKDDKVWIVELVDHTNSIVLGYWKEEPIDTDIKNAFIEKSMSYYQYSIINNPEYCMTEKDVREGCEEELDFRAIVKRELSFIF